MGKELAQSLRQTFNVVGPNFVLYEVTIQGMVLLPTTEVEIAWFELEGEEISPEDIIDMFGEEVYQKILEIYLYGQELVGISQKIGTRTIH